MKIQLFSLLCSLAQIASTCADERKEREIEAQQVELWKNRLEEASTMPPSDKIAHLWLGLRNMAWRISNTDQSPEVDSTFLEIQQELLATPGHAQYFADKLEDERARLKPREFRGYYTDHVRHYLDETLVHLPSPETVTVLGHYLNDDRDKPESPYSKGGTPPYPGTAVIAFGALSKIGLRDLPVTDMAIEEDQPAPGEEWTLQQHAEAIAKVMIAYQARQEEALAKYRVWWEEVKSGRRTFSFVGQNVEYRFKPDGTWDTLTLANPPDDATKPLKPLNANQERPEKQPVTSAPTKENENPWPLIMVLVVALPALGFWLLMKKSRSE